MEDDKKAAFGSAFGEVLLESGFPGAVVEPAGDDDGLGADILCTVGLAGGLSGFLTLRFIGSALASVARRMTSHCGISIGEGDGSFLRETAAELANQLAGRAVNTLARHGVDCAITPPTVVTGSNVRAAVPHLADRQTWKVDAGVAEFLISVSTRKS